MAVAAEPGTSGFSIADLRGNRRRNRTDATFRRAFFAMALVSVVVSVLIIASLVGEAWTFISQVELASLNSIGWFPRRGEYDLGTLVVGTLIVAVVAMAVAAPLGIGAAIYLSEYASPRFRKVVKPTLEILAGIPSVVLGFFAFTVISPEVVQRFFSDATQSNMLAAGLGVGILVIPLMASVSEDALQAVPQSLREGAYGMGAKKMTVSLRVVLPAAISGLVAALILSISRAIGETMVVLLAAGGAGGALFTTDPLDQGLTMTAAMATQARGTDAVVGEGLTFQSLFFVGFLLFAITLMLNMVAGRVVRRVRHVY